MKALSYLILLFCGVFAIACSDDFLYSSSNDEFSEGCGIVKMEMDFMPLAESSINTRSWEGNTMRGKELEDLCIVVYDKDGNLLDGFPVEVNSKDHGLTIDYDIERNDDDASNGKKAEDKTAHASFNMRLPFGVYYIYGIANLGKRDESGNLTQKTVDAIKDNAELAEAVKTKDGLRDYSVGWDSNNKYNNFSLFGSFSNKKPERSPATGDDMNNTKVSVNSPGINLHCWMRRCVTKVTVDFDGSNLLSNVAVYIKKATIHDIPKKCKLGKPNKPTDRETDLYSYKDTGYWIDETKESKDSYSPTEDADAIFFGTGDEYAKWPAITKSSPYLVDDSGNRMSLHNQNSDAMFLYENMQGDWGIPDNKVQHPDKDGTVVGADSDEKDEVLCGSYIEVEGYYIQTLSNGQDSQGKIIYRFMLGKDALNNFDVERNYHIKVTLKFRGNANDVDWHIDYNQKSGFEVKDPYYVSYLYNHDSTIHFRYTPEEGFDIAKIDAEIVGNNWWPDPDSGEDYYINAANEQNPLRGDENWETSNFNAHLYPDTDPLLNGKRKYLGNGFLSLRASDLLNINGADIAEDETMDKWTTKEKDKYMNDRFFYGIVGSGGVAPMDQSKRTYYFDGTDDPTKNGRENYFKERQSDGSYRVNLPMFTRPKNLVKQTGYSGNNPYESAYRTAYVKLTVHVYNKQTKESNSEEKIVRVKQVPRVVNPKGIYRKSGNNENFKVRLLERRTAASDFVDVNSDGPWIAEVLGDENFITLNGKKTIEGGNGAITFNVLFNKLNKDNKVRNAIIRIRYHNYTCVHLIFVRQGYDPLQISPNGVKWHTGNLVYGNYESLDPRDEGSLFRYGNLKQPIDVKSNSLEAAFSVPSDLWIAKSDGSESTDKLTWSKIGSYALKDVAKYPDDWKNSNIATMDNIKELYSTENVTHGFGVLYADGATEVQTNRDKAFGYYRHDGDKTKGMRGVFAYYWNGDMSSDTYNCKNIFFPIGRSGFGHRRSWDGDVNRKGVLRYASGRSDFNYSLWMPLFYDLFKRQGALYFGKEPKIIADVTGATSGEPCAGLDLNYYTFDVNAITWDNFQKHSQWNGCEDIGCVNACFIRCVDN